MGEDEDMEGKVHDQEDAPGYLLRSANFECGNNGARMKAQVLSLGYVREDAGARALTAGGHEIGEAQSYSVKDMICEVSIGRNLRPKREITCKRVENSGTQATECAG